MKIEIDKEIFFEKINMGEPTHHAPGESFAEVLAKEIEFTEDKKTSVFMEIKKSKVQKDILDTLIDI